MLTLASAHKRQLNLIVLSTFKEFLKHLLGVLLLLAYLAFSSFDGEVAIPRGPIYSYMATHMNNFGFLIDHNIMYAVEIQHLF